jgi:hypothetical protein
LRVLCALCGEFRFVSPHLADFAKPQSAQRTFGA